MKPFALVLFCILMTLAAPALALQERTITDEPGVQAPSKQPAATSGASPAAKAPAPASQATTPAPVQAPAKEYTPASKSDEWTPPASTGKDTPIQDDGASSGSTPDSTDVTQMPEAKQVQVSTYSRKEVDEQVMGFFEGGARGFADLISKAFNQYGRPVGFIKGNEGAGALVVGLRYGEGWLHLKSGQKIYVYWQSPSVGFDLGVNASKVFCLVYGMTDVNQIFQRYPSVDGSAYVVGGFGMNYQRSGNVVLAPIRFGVGLRLGANVGYMGFTKERTINPF